MENAEHMRAEIHKLEGKLDRLLMESSDIRIQIAKMEVQLDQNSGHAVKVEKNAEKIQGLELVNVETKVKLGLWGGIAGVASILWQIVAHLR